MSDVHRRRGRGRMRSAERRRRTAHFAQLMARDPWHVFNNARTAGLSYQEAERLLMSPEFVALTEGLADAQVAEAA